MSRGPGRIELGVLDVLARFSRICAEERAKAAAERELWSKTRRKLFLAKTVKLEKDERPSLDAITIAQLVFRMGMFSRPTKAELGSVRRAIRRLAARGTLIEDHPDREEDSGGRSRTQWLLANPDDVQVVTRTAEHAVAASPER